MMLHNGLGPRRGYKIITLHHLERETASIFLMLFPQDPPYCGTAAMAVFPHAVFTLGNNITLFHNCNAGPDCTGFKYSTLTP